jgi:hypothetical protein
MIGVRARRAHATLVCTSEPSIEAFITYGFEEAMAIIERHRGLVLAIARALIEHPERTQRHRDRPYGGAPSKTSRASRRSVAQFQGKAALLLARRSAGAAGRSGHCQPHRTVTANSSAVSATMVTNGIP